MLWELVGCRIPVPHVIYMDGALIRNTPGVTRNGIKIEVDHVDNARIAGICRAAVLCSEMVGMVRTVCHIIGESEKCEPAGKWNVSRIA